MCNNALLTMEFPFMTRHRLEMRVEILLQEQTMNSHLEATVIHMHTDRHPPNHTSAGDTHTHTHTFEIHTYICTYIYNNHLIHGTIHKKMLDKYLSCQICLPYCAYT